MKVTKRDKTIQTLRMMAQSCEKAAYWLERGNVGMATMMFRIGVLEGYLPWLRTRYKDWRDK
jgi:hypothetical protein